MGIFGQSSPFDADVEKATSETNTNDNWSFILDVCDKVTTNPRSAKDCLKSIMKRMGHADPHVVMQAITLMDACANNCGKPFHLEIASRDFETEFRRLLTKAQPKVSLKMRQMLKNWAENDFKNDAELNLIPSFYAKLRSEGYDFTNLNEKSDKSVPKTTVQKDPTLVGSRQEEDDIAKAIELSLKESKSISKQNNNVGNGNGDGLGKSAYTSLYPSFGGGNGSVSAVSSGSGSFGSNRVPPEPRKVRALYDFEAAEENELTFFASEIIHVIDDSDANWWRGYNQRGEGLFPSNFVTADLSVDLDRLDVSQHKSGKNNEINVVEKKTDEAGAVITDTVALMANQPVEIDEIKIDRALYLLHEANPEDSSQDSEEMLHIEQHVNRMGTLIDTELERVDRKHAQLTQLSSDLVDAINLYHSLMRDDLSAQFNSTTSIGYIGPMPGLAYNQALYSGSNSSFPMGQQQSFKTGVQSLQHSVNSECRIEGGNNYVINANQSPQLTSQIRHEQASQLNAAPAPQTQIFQQHGQDQRLQTNFQVLSKPQQQYPNSVPNAVAQPAASVASTTANSIPVTVPTQLYTHFMSPRHQHQQQQQQQNHITYMLAQQTNPTQFASVLPNGEPNFQSLPIVNSHKTHANSHQNIEQFNQLQQQMAAISMGINHPTAIHIPSAALPLAAPPPQEVSQLIQGDSVKANIPIYHQHR